MNLEEQLAQAVKLVEDVKAQIAANKELKPFDWKGHSRYFVGAAGGVHFVHSNQCSATKLFYSKSRGEAERFAHKLSILSCINNLKKSLGCNWEFTSGCDNYELHHCKNTGVWWSRSTSGSERMGTVFKTHEDAYRVVGYLNKAYPNGWSLPQGGA